MHLKNERATIYAIPSAVSVRRDLSCDFFPDFYHLTNK